MGRKAAKRFPVMECMRRARKFLQLGDICVVCRKEWHRGKIGTGVMRNRDSRQQPVELRGESFLAVASVRCAAGLAFFEQRSTLYRVRSTGERRCREKCRWGGGEAGKVARAPSQLSCARARETGFTNLNRGMVPISHVSHGRAACVAPKLVMH